MKSDVARKTRISLLQSTERGVHAASIFKQNTATYLIPSLAEKLALKRPEGRAPDAGA
jgi:hypothetical protein